MGKEIERKFLVRDDSWREAAQALEIRQGYLCSGPERVVRVRTIGDQAWLTVKGETRGITRREFEYEIPAGEGRQMLDGLCERPLIEKRRHVLQHAGYTWEVDEFFGENEGLVVAEVELEDAKAEIPLPPWAGEEVSGDSRYFNASLIRKPYSSWKKD
ncbi:MAG: CYTH domain-containing protein [Chromatiales bacterium]|nr:CYTH domain-containing protein [Chromatiales bacterium]